MYHCPCDKGQEKSQLTPSDWATLGCSYHYNAGIQLYDSDLTPDPFPKDPFENLAEKPDHWVSEPAKHILFFEPPATKYKMPTIFINPGMPTYWYQWHLSLPIHEFADPRLARAKFFSPIGFVDGHSATHDFTKSIVGNIKWP